MNVLFEEDGAFKAASILTDNDSSLQVETPSGRRAKIKATNVLLRFREPGCGDLLDAAEAQAETIDTEFLYEVSGEAEFGFGELAGEYYGHPPDAVESAAILLRLHSAPMWFHRKGKGRFRKAPPEILQAALAGLEKKKLQAAAVERMTGELLAGRLPAEFPPMLEHLLYKPDRNRLETKALEAACGESGLSVPKLLARAGGLSSSHDYHLGRFLFEHFPEGTDFPPHDDAIVPADLPLAAVRAFSIDDAQTTEIDDALSVTSCEPGGWRIGIHIAAPGLGFAPGSALDAIARRRLSTVYMPGCKITMLPDALVEHFTLTAGKNLPALSLYLDVTSDLRIAGSESRIERVPVVANLRHHDIEPLFNDQTVASGEVPPFEFRDELMTLWRFATVCEAGRGKPTANQLGKDYNFRVDWDAAGEDGPGRIEIDERKRGSPLDKLVSETMIIANSTWGRLLDQANIPGLYRAQSGGKVRMTTAAAPHEGLGVDCYAWSSSPLRRYVDLVNQWQLIALLQDEPAPFAPKSEALLTAMRDFELTYAAYAEFQRGMERYWCLRWLRQEKATRIEARVLRESLVRAAHLPLVLRVPSLPALDAGTAVRLEIEAIDLMDAEIRARYLELAPEPSSDAMEPEAAAE
ncbi:MAG: RNB domain-containing ribonuclease [Sterolibacteriaceae bacterium]|jgi:exoribonuclease-2|nr:RNB domain-containing ribonuclease [Sterolibacteriaceae bacterium]MBK9086704.1 RNB domain-containing ribonuclease [Sterolibacteriaceae bacterium]